MDEAIERVSRPPAFPDIDITNTLPATTTTTPLLQLPDVDDLVRKAEVQARLLARLKEATSSFTRRDARLGQLREKTLLLRSRAKFEWKNCHEYRRFVRQSQEAFNEEAAAMMTPAAVEDYEERLVRLQNLHDVVLRDFDAQNVYAERANDLQTELGDLEYELQIKELSVKDAADIMKQILNDLVLPGSSSAATVVETEVPPSPSTLSSEDVHPLVDNYFLKAGHVNSLVEQSIELEIEYAEARGEREFKAEHDQSLEISQEDFEVLWQQSRNDITNQLTEARRMAHTARDACHDNGLDPDKHRRRPRRDSDRSVSDAVGDEIDRRLEPNAEHRTILSRLDNDSAHTFPVLRADSSPDLTIRQPQMEDCEVPLEDRVLGWIQDLEAQPTANTRIPKLQQPDLMPRRSVSVSSPLSQSSRSQTHPPLQTLKTPERQNGPARLVCEARTDYNGFLKRRSSDSNISVMLQNHDPDLGFLGRLKEFAMTEL